MGHIIESIIAALLQATKFLTSHHGILQGSIVAPFNHKKFISLHIESLLTQRVLHVHKFYANIIYHYSEIPGTHLKILAPDVHAPVMFGFDFRVCVLGNRIECF